MGPKLYGMGENVRDNITVLRMIMEAMGKAPTASTGCSTCPCTATPEAGSRRTGSARGLDPMQNTYP